MISSYCVVKSQRFDLCFEFWIFPFLLVGNTVACLTVKPFFPRTHNRNDKTDKNMSNSVIPPPYAPTSSASYTGARAGASAYLDTEIKLVTSTKEREHYDSLAEIYAVLTSLEFLERAYLRDSILHTEYTPTCLRLLAQYNGIVGSNPALLGDAGIEGFRDRYGVSATHAISRLKIGVPATVEHAIMESGGSGSGGAGGAGGANGSGGMGASARAVAEATGVSITGCAVKVLPPLGDSRGYQWRRPSTPCY